MTHRTLFPPPDENRALEQLERLHREILRARRDRERAGTEFDGFVAELHDHAEDGTRAVPVERAARRAPRAIVPSTDRASASAQSARPSAAADAPSVRPPESPVPAAARGPEQAEAVESIPALAAPPRRVPWGFVAVAVGVILGAAGAFYLWPRASQPAAQQQAPPTPGPSRTTSAAAPTQPTPAPPAAPGGAQRQAPLSAPTVSPSTVQLTTDRAVWMRVTVDGQKVLEREVPAGQHLTYNPSSVIVIRAGDAGGVRVKVGNGPEEVLGRNAFPVTRRFAVPKP